MCNHRVYFQDGMMSFHLAFTFHTWWKYASERLICSMYFFFFFFQRSWKLRLLCKFSISYISVGNLCRLRICPFHPSCRIYWHRVVHALTLLMCVGSILWWCPLFLMLAMCVCGFFLFFLISLARVLSILSIFSKNQHLIFLYCFLFFISALFPSIKIYFFQLYKIETLFYAFLFFKCEV